MEEGKFYHIFNRGNNRENIFKERENYFYFLKQYDKYLNGVVDTYAYCLMPNHFHLLIKVKEAADVKVVNSMGVSSALTVVEKAFRDFFISYAKSINKKYNRVGSLFQYKFKRKPVDSERYLKQLVLYIHQNPVEAGICNQPDEWEFSTFNKILDSSTAWVKRDEVIDWFEDKENFRHCHRSLVELEMDI